MSRLLESTDFGPAGFKWLTLKRLKRLPGTVQPVNVLDCFRIRFWESAERTTRSGECDAVAIIPKVRAKGQPLRLLLEAQFRPPQDAVVIEFPAGLIDAGEDAGQAALRELKEETGYSGTLLDVSPIGFADPGMTNSNMCWATVDIDADSPVNCKVQPQLEDGEFIQTFLLPLDNLYERLQDLQKTKGWAVDIRLQIYAYGLKHGKEWPVSSNRYEGQPPEIYPIEELGGANGQHSSPQKVAQQHAEYQKMRKIIGPDKTLSEAFAEATVYGFVAGTGLAVAACAVLAWLTRHRK